MPPFQTQEFSKQSVSSWGGFSWVQHDRPTEPPQIRWPCKLRVAAPSRKQITVVRPSQMGQRSTRAHQVRNKRFLKWDCNRKNSLGCIYVHPKCFESAFYDVSASTICNDSPILWLVSHIGLLRAIHLLNLFEESFLDNWAFQFLRGRQKSCFFGEIGWKDHELLDLEGLEKWPTKRSAVQNWRRSANNWCIWVTLLGQHLPLLLAAFTAAVTVSIHTSHWFKEPLHWYQMVTASWKKSLMGMNYELWVL